MLDELPRKHRVKQEKILLVPIKTKYIILQQAPQSQLFSQGQDLTHAVIKYNNKLQNNDKFFIVDNYL